MNTTLRLLIIVSAIVALAVVGGVFFSGNNSQKEGSRVPVAEVEKFLLSKFSTYSQENVAAEKLGKASVPAFIQFLRNPRGDITHCQSRCVAALGVIADSSATDSLIDFFENASPDDPTFAVGKSLSDSDTLVALRNVPRALSKIAEQGDKKALVFLTKYSSPQIWKNTQLPWAVADFKFFSDDRTTWEAWWLRECIYMLGATGRQEARATLEQLRNTHYSAWATTALAASKRSTFSQRVSRLYRHGEGREFRSTTSDLFWDITDWLRFHPIWSGLFLGVTLMIAIAVVWLKVKKRRCAG